MAETRITLEERYNGAPETTYVGRVRMRQAADVGGNKPGVDFMDGSGRGSWSSGGGTPAPDEFQTEIKRNAAGDFRYGGGAKSPALTNDSTYPLSRWLDKSLKIAFDGVGPASLPTGYHRNNRFTLLNDNRNMNVKLHNYTPRLNDDYTNTLIELSKGHVTGAPSGPSPSGLSG